MVAFIVFMWNPGSRLRGIMGKRPSLSVSACLSTLDTTVHWHAHTCIYTVAANTHTYQKNKQTTLCPVTEEKNRSADTRKLEADVCLERKSIKPRGKAKPRQK